MPRKNSKRAVAVAAPSLAAAAVAATVIVRTARGTSAYARSSAGTVPLHDARPAHAPLSDSPLSVMPLTARHADGAFSVAPLSTADLAAVALLSARFALSGPAAAHLPANAFDGAIAVYRINGARRCPTHPAGHPIGHGVAELSVAAAGPVYAGQTPCGSCGRFHPLPPITNADRVIHAARIARRALETLAGRSIDLPGDDRGAVGATARAAAAMTLAADLYPSDAARAAVRFPAALLP